MDKKGAFDSRRVNDYYIKSKENEMKKLDEKKISLEKQISVLKEELDNNKRLLSKKENESQLIEQQYEGLVRMVESKGITFEIENKNYDIKDWDSLNLAKRGSNYIVMSKKGDELEILDRETSFILRDLLNEKTSYSFVVVRVTSKSIRAQFRIKKVSE
jgi:hypothetical protein